MISPTAPAAAPATSPAALATRRRIPAPLWDAAVEARRRLEAASAEAAALLSRAREEAERLRAAASRAGREEGLAGVTELLARAVAERDRLLASAEPQLVELAFAIARTVLARAVERDPGSVVETARRALEAARGRERVTVRAHPADLPALLEAALGREEVPPRALAMRPDAAVERGGVVIETEVGTVEARLSSQLEALRRALGAGDLAAIGDPGERP